MFFFSCFTLLSWYFLLVCLLNSLALILFISLKSPRGNVTLIIPHTPGVLSCSTVLALAFISFHFAYLSSFWALSAEHSNILHSRILLSLVIHHHSGRHGIKQVRKCVYT